MVESTSKITVSAQELLDLRRRTVEAQGVLADHLDNILRLGSALADARARIKELEDGIERIVGSLHEGGVVEKDQG